MSNKIYKLFSPIITGYFNRTFYDIAKLAQEIVFIIYIYLSVLICIRRARLFSKLRYIVIYIIEYPLKLRVSHERRQNLIHT